MEACKEGNAEGVVGIYHCLTRDGLMIYRLDRNAVGKKGWRVSLILFLRLFLSSYTRFWSLFVDVGPSMEDGRKEELVLYGRSSKERTGPRSGLYIAPE